MGIRELLAQDTRKDLLRFLTCGSVDDGKSTLIGRLLHDSKQIYDDHLVSLERDSKRVGSAGVEIDFSLLLDGLKAEREQGITIDVAYRYFSTPRRKFIIADCPGHVQYTRNMITGGSTANLAVVLIDARNGVQEQTRRHSFLVSLLDIPHIVVAINKMDAVDYSASRFEEIRQDYSDFAARLAVRNISFIPMSALRGDNVVDSSDNMPWYRGRTLLDHLESVHVASDRNLIDFRLPIQYVLRQSSDFRGFCGTVASGLLRANSEVEILPSRKRTRVTQILGFSGPLEQAFPPMSVTVTLADEVDVSRGDVLVYPHNLPRVASAFECVLVWMDETSLARDRPYIVKLGTTETRGQIAALRYRFDVNTLHRSEADRLELNEIGRARIELARAVAFDPYKSNRSTGSFILIDPVSHRTVGAGMIIDRITEDDHHDHDRDVTSLHPKQSRVTLVERADRIEQSPLTIWITGLPKAGKSTVAFALERALFDAGFVSYALDGANLRLGISDDLGFQALERSEATRRAAHVARLMNEAGMITIVALVSPTSEDRLAAREIIGDGRFVEVYLSAPVEVCEARDDEGLYARARAGELKRFTGVSAPYEVPASPDLEIASHQVQVAEAVKAIMDLVVPRIRV